MAQCALLTLGRLRIAVMAEAAGGVNHPSLYESLGLNVGAARAVVMKTASNFQYFASGYGSNTWAQPSMVRGRCLQLYAVVGTAAVPCVGACSGTFMPL